MTFMSPLFKNEQTVAPIPTPERFCYIPMLIKKENSCQNLSELLHCISLKPSEALIVWGLTVCRRDIFRVIANASSITKCQ